MDTGKLLKIIEDIQKDEQNFGFQAVFQNILNFYNENNRDALNKEKERLYNDLLRSLLSNYVMTDYKIMEGLGVTKYFGNGSQQELDRILGSQAHEVKSELETYVNQRQESLNKLENVKNSLIAFGVKPRVLADNQYEIGFYFPEEYTDLANLEDLLGDIKNFLISLAVAANESKSFKINSVSNGSIEFFINAGLKLADYFGAALDYALKIYAAVKACEDLRNNYQNFVKKRKDAIEKLNKEEADEKTQKLVDEFIKKLGIKEPEKETSVRQLFKKMLKHIGKGVSAEVRTPSLPEPEPPTANAGKDIKKDFSEKKKLYEVKTKLDEKNKEIFILQQNNFYGINTQFLDIINNTEEKKNNNEK